MAGLAHRARGSQGSQGQRPYLEAGGADFGFADERNIKELFKVLGNRLFFRRGHRPCGQIPEFNRVITCCRSDLFPIRRECYGVKPTHMTFKRSYYFPMSWNYCFWCVMFDKVIHLSFGNRCCLVSILRCWDIFHAGRFRSQKMHLHFTCHSKSGLRSFKSFDIISLSIPKRRIEFSGVVDCILVQYYSL